MEVTVLQLSGARSLYRVVVHRVATEVAAATLFYSPMHR
jgi:hypothetical protein